ncbi:EthD domain-containing protein [Nocardiopsis sp. RSe5-2]|uniref:EthD domain-containing protein n=1 Tax=Nocardiopsis endophytica TaxID=3018445 RepID=A0ABT4TWL3_9ACTN|nr:EthD domain-containing protein [Nocardiopsis endophytica]MDA2809099.1 EthD domain-containing protein [Nocardiopsis endophytica]
MTFKDVLVTRGPRPGTGRREGQDYVVDKHAALAMSVPAIRGLFTCYAMNRVLGAEDGAGAGAPALYRRPDDLLVVVEHACADRRSFDAVLEDREYLATVRPDEIRMGAEIFSEPPTAYEVVEEAVLGGGRERGDPAGDGALVAFDFLRRRPGTGPEEFAAALTEEAAWLGADPGYRAVVHRREHNLVQGGPGALDPAAADRHDAIVATAVTGFADLAGVLERLRERQAGYVDPDASTSVLTRRTVIV